MDPYVSNWFYWICDQKDVYLKGGPIPGASQYEAPPKDLCSDGLWKTRLDADPWVVSGANVRYCLSETVSSQCHLNVAVNLLWVVIAFNIIKLIIVCVLVTSNLINKYPLVTIGDAAASFIESPDPKTKAMCLYTAKEITSSKSIQTAGTTLAREYLSTKHRWSAAVSKRRWILASTLTFLALAIILSLLGYAATILRRNYSRGSLASLWGFGLGAITPYTLITNWAIPTHGDGAVVGAVLVANLPQLLLSLLYLVLNSVVTSMAVAAEWGGHAGRRRALRVSVPRGRQRSSYFLQLPYRLGAPLLAASVLVHWLVSQSLFVAQVNQVWPGERAAGGVDPSLLDPDDSLTTGYAVGGEL
ncbi:hypothetical protein UCRNP2_1525 [Neofusicoccum parvum UCRNP2]|uniref:Uncharacterized protein n=1 Tax=Botryosphaeria parva (strain UCR-NP2) TaxID=1287680 RepID=R1GTS5_BOTPV|nr:hypothetical protein UCRNP2_1525 [Neofusicoccum parvum UCRNP2]